MSVTKFAFLSPNSAGATLCTDFPLTLVNTSLSGVYSCNTLPLVVAHQKEGRRATELPDSITGLLMSVYDCL